MSEIKVLAPEDIGAYCDIIARAYPGWKILSEEEKDRTRQSLLRIQEGEPSVTLYGLFREGELVGGMRFHDFSMNFLGARIAAGGVGLVAVDLLHKKEHVAKEMMEYFLRHYRDRGFPLVLLYPFRPDFYRKMGFGYGAKKSQYRVRPSTLPKGPKSHVRYLDESDRQLLAACYNRILDRTHGLIEKSGSELDRMFADPKHQVVGYKVDGQVQGYLLFTFEHGESFLLNDISVLELLYENQQALSELLAFLHDQADQIRHVIFNTQDEDFHYVLQDPRNPSGKLIPSVYHETNTQGIGIMYRVIDVPGILSLLRERDFGHQTCRFTLAIEDSLLADNGGSVVVGVEDGRISLPAEGRPDSCVRMGIAEFSSMLIGAVRFGSLYQYGLADVTDPAMVATLDRMFAVTDKPICTTPF